MSQRPPAFVSRRPREKYVFAHFMVGNTYPYTRDDWIDDIQLASRSGFDGFALNVGKEEWQRERVSDCYEAASRYSTSSFKLFISFDMTSIPSTSNGDVEGITRYIRPYVNHKNQFYYDDKLVISTFSGENSVFGHRSFEKGWEYVISVLQELVPIMFLPSFFINPTKYPALSFMDGYFNWNGGWPIHLTPESPPSEISFPKLDTDYHHLHHLGGRTFMAAASPWFFTHYAPDSWNKNWIYHADDWLFVRRWEQLVAMRDKVDIVQVISWNDYGESHYVGPIKGEQPNSQAWVDGFPHEPWLHINRYFSRAFKAGHYSHVEHDKLILWGRPHSKHAVAPDPVPKPRNWQLTDDRFWVTVFASASATLELSSGSEHPGVFEVGPGVTKLSHPFVDGGSMKASLFRHGQLVAGVDAATAGFRIQKVPEVYNFNVFVAMSD